METEQWAMVMGLVFLCVAGFCFLFGMVALRKRREHLFLKEQAATERLTAIEELEKRVRLAHRAKGLVFLSATVVGVELSGEDGLQPSVAYSLSTNWGEVIKVRDRPASVPILDVLDSVDIRISRVANPGAE